MIAIDYRGSSEFFAKINPSNENHPSIVVYEVIQMNELIRELLQSYRAEL